jgi:hypothetical protein
MSKKETKHNSTPSNILLKKKRHGREKEGFWVVAR